MGYDTRAALAMARRQMTSGGDRDTATAWALVAIAETLVEIADSLASLDKSGIEMFTTHDGAVRER